MKATVHVTLKPGVLDPQGQAIGHALSGLGFAGVNAVRMGKFLELDLAETDKAKKENEATGRQVNSSFPSGGLAVA